MHSDMAIHRGMAGWCTRSGCPGVLVGRPCGAHGDIANVLLAIYGDPNTSIHTTKVLTCSLHKGRLAICRQWPWRCYGHTAALRAIDKLLASGRKRWSRFLQRHQPSGGVACSSDIARLL